MPSCAPAAPLCWENNPKQIKSPGNRKVFRQPEPRDYGPGAFCVWGVKALPCAKGGDPAQAGAEKLTVAMACHDTSAPEGDALRWGDFLLPESHQRPPKAGPSPALWNPPRWCWVKLRPFVSALGLAGSHRWLGCSMGSTCSYGNPFFYFQGLTLVKQLFPAAGSLALGGGNTAPPK